MNKKRSDHFDLQTVFDILFTRKLLVSICVIVAILFGVYHQYRATSSFLSAEAIIGFNYTGIEKGQDPAGGKFDASSIKSPSIILGALKKAGLDKKVSDASVKNAITITPIVPNDVAEKITQQQLEAKNGVKTTDSYEYYPNQYIITFNVNKAWKLSHLEAQQIVDAMIDVYAASFYNQYGYQPYVSNIVSNIDVKSFDYPDVGLYLKNQINYLTSFAQTKSKASPMFRSTSTSLSFDDIYNSVNNVKRVKFDQLTALVDSYALTNDKDNRIKIYESQMNDLTISMNKYLDEKKVVLEALNKMDNGKQLFYLPKSSTSNDNTLYTSDARIELVNPEYNSLIEQYTNAGVQAANASNDIKDLERKISYLKKDHYSAEEKTVATQKVDALLNSIVTDLNHWVGLTNQAASDYYKADPLNLAVRTVSPAVYKSNISKTAFVKTAAVYGVFGFLVGFIIAAFLFFLKKRKENQISDTIEHMLANNEIVSNSGIAVTKTHTASNDESPVKEEAGTHT